MACCLKKGNWFAVSHPKTEIKVHLIFCLPKVPTTLSLRQISLNALNKKGMNKWLHPDYPLSPYITLISWPEQ